MLLGENFRVSLEALRANKVRSLLTTLGIVIGVAAVIAVVSIVQGLEFKITEQLQGVGANFMMIFPDVQNERPGVFSRPIKLTWEDGQEIVRKVPGVTLITPVIAGQKKLRYRDRQHDPQFVLGVSESWQEVMNHAVGEGRFLSRVDLANRRKVICIGRKVADELELGREPVGKEIYVGDLPVTVIGIMEERGESLGVDLDDLAFLPFDSALGLFGRNAGDQVQLRLKTRDTESVDPVKDAVTALLRRRHRLAAGVPDDFQIQTQDELLRTIDKILTAVTAVVGGVVGIALLVGGIGIMNIMLVSVTERTREIGVRKALGAKRRDVLVQFLIEALALSLVGGLIGLALGYGMGTGIAKMLPGEWPPAHVPFWAIALSIGFSGLVGAFFGSYPAARAARLDPVEALRYE
ncbi:MAG TPA: ABC transporter permease [Thermoanaerobaculia bacterium]|nr:ABC transporter permease [Thermoanaerobaculia bacterium]